MQQECVECGALFDVTNRKNARKFCDEKCRERRRHRENGITAGTYRGISWPARLDVCLHCGGDMSGTAPNARYCGEKCRMNNHHLDEKVRRHENSRSEKGWGPGSLINCKLDGCGAVFVTDGIRKFCSPAHLRAFYRKIGPAGPDGTWTFPCPDCAQPTISRAARPARCGKCRVRRQRAKDQERHRRRGGNLLTVSEIAERDGTQCHICHRRVDMSLSGNDRMGPTVEHIECLSWGEVEPDPYNEVLAHRSCNVRRGNREPSQMVLALT